MRLSEVGLVGQSQVSLVTLDHGLSHSFADAAPGVGTVHDDALEELLVFSISPDHVVLLFVVALFRFFNSSRFAIGRHQG